ncbi:MULTISPECIES: hypothetical protein [Acinetobacter]|uniref:Uncharacterized protein n=2 Tax=Pseudomonadati TaxID=3379134 RepID=N9PUH3_9GAMM|nr:MULTISPECIES: hypothetical protein [Acinetobacter]ENX37174.1 hypothetical protein F888_02510 [Acinetobacter courvalinii]MEB3790660.1 hypothetical protein [Acinetobacter sp. IK40]GGH28940.1 hypothetical protein GCM10007354_08060 [Acinetobacter courvalinii]
MSNSEIFTVDTEYEIYYTNKNFIPIDEIISSLKALESNIHHTSKFIEKAYPDFKVLDSEIFIENLQSGSLNLKLIIRKSLHAAKANAKKITHIAPSKETIKDIVKQATIALIVEGTKLATASPQVPVTNQNITINNNITNIQSMNLSESDYNSIISKISQKTLAENAINITKPAKLEDDAQIKFNHKDKEEVVFDRKVLDPMPSTYTPPVQEERETFHQDIKLSIYASDKDRRENGWAGSIHSLNHNRVTLKLNNSVKPEQLHGRTEVIASVLVHEKFNSLKKKYEISYIEILGFKS